MQVRVAAAASAAAVVIMQFVDYGVFHLRVRALDGLTHASIPGVASLSALAMAACGSFAVAATGRRSSMTWVALGGVLLCVLALRLAHPIHVLVFGLPVMAAALALLLMQHVRLLRDGCVVLAGSLIIHAFGSEIVSALGYGVDSWAYQVKAVVKHGGELAGWLLVAGGVLVILEDDRGGSLVRRRAPVPARRGA
jgi:hypothetical protein